MSSATGGTASDAQLILGSVTDADRFAELYDRLVDDVLRFFVRRTRCAQTAADLTAETFAAVFTSRGRFVDTGAPGRAWVFTIARRQLSHFHRRERVADRARRRLGVEPIALAGDETDRIDALIDAAGLRADLHRAMSTIPTGLAEAVHLRVELDLPYSAVAARLGCSEGAARVRVSRALTRLSEELGADR